MKFKSFQKQDLARLALHDGAVCAWDKGLGKTLAMYTWALLKCGLLSLDSVGRDSVEPASNQPAGPVLLVAPGDVHQQVMDDGRDLLKARTTLLESQSDFLARSTQDPHSARRVLPPGFYLTSYTGLALNGAARFPQPKDHSIEGMIALLNITPAQFEKYWQERGTRFASDYQTLNCSPDVSFERLGYALTTARRSYSGNAWRITVDAAYDRLQHLHAPGVNTFANLREDQLVWIQRTVIHELCLAYSENIGETQRLPDTQHRVKCVYSPTLADLSSESFTAVAVDEGVKMKGEDTIIGHGIRQMNPKYRLVLSGTPIKNRLPDIFRLAHWATGHHDEPTARWPYAAETSEREAFAEEFLLAERNLSKEQKSEANKRFVKLSPQVCNIHRLWKLFGPIIVRRLKSNIGQDIVAKHRHVIRVPMGTAQAATYRYHMEAEYKDCNGMKAVGAQLQALRCAAAAPHAVEHLQPKPIKLRGRKDITASDYVSSQSYIPKYAIALSLIRQCMERGEQIAVFSALIEPLEAMARRLKEAGVPFIIAHGGHSPARRRKLSADFKRGRDGGKGIPVILASGECMAEAHSWHLCNNVTHLAYSWAFDKLSQCIDRCHRLNSVKDLNYHALLCDGTVDRVLENNLHEKGNTSDLVLDGQLMDTNPEEVSLGEILMTAAAEFDAETKTIDERVLEAEWPALRDALGDTYRQWRDGSSPAAPKPAAIEPPKSGLIAAAPVQTSPVIRFPAEVHPWKQRMLTRQNLQQLALV